MANDLNLCQFIGRLGKDPEVRYTAGGQPVANFSIAVGKSWKDKASGEKRESTEWINVVIWGKLAEICQQHLAKGSQVYLSGEWRTRKWQDKNGQDRYSTELYADKMQMLGGGSEKPSERTAVASGGRRENGLPTFDDDDLDIPF